jgi:hypothetical protein
MPSLADRMLRAAKLDVALYEEVEGDKTATGQAMTVVILSAVAAGLGATRHAGARGLIAMSVIALVGWVVWSALTYWIGTRILPEPTTQADLGQLLRSIGFASAPGVVRILGILPGLGALVALIAAVWMLVAMVIAVRQALDYTSTGRAVGVCLIGWIVQAVVIFGLMLLFGVRMAGVSGQIG